MKILKSAFCPSILPVVLIDEELDLLKGVGTGPVADQVRVQLQKRVQGRGARLLWANHQEVWKPQNKYVTPQFNKI